MAYCVLCFTLRRTIEGATSHQSSSNATWTSRDLGEECSNARGLWPHILTLPDWLGWRIVSSAIHCKAKQSMLAYWLLRFAWTRGRYYAWITSVIVISKVYSFDFCLLGCVAQDVYLVHLLNELAGNSFMVFCSTCSNTQRTALLLRNLGFTAIPLHGQMGQVSFLPWHSPWSLPNWSMWHSSSQTFL